MIRLGKPTFRATAVAATGSVVETTAPKTSPLFQSKPGRSQCAANAKCFVVGVREDAKQS